MAGLNVTHQAIFTPELHHQLLLPSGETNTGQSIDQLYQSASPLRRLVSSAMTFFASTYEAEFQFDQGPPIHDMLAVAYVLNPMLFFSKCGSKRRPSQKYAVKVDTSHGISSGTTLVDFFHQWGVPEVDDWQGKALVLEYVEVSLDLFLFLL